MRRLRRDHTLTRGALGTWSRRPILEEESPPWLPQLPHLRLRVRLLRRAGTHKVEDTRLREARQRLQMHHAHQLLPSGLRSLAANEALLEVVRVPSWLDAKPATMPRTTKAERAARGLVRPSRSAHRSFFVKEEADFKHVWQTARRWWIDML